MVVAVMVVSVAGLLAVLDMAVLMGVTVGLSDIMRRRGNRGCSESRRKKRKSENLLQHTVLHCKARYRRAKNEIVAADAVLNGRRHREYDFDNFLSHLLLSLLRIQKEAGA
jgi:hypothetical protein